MPASPIRPDPNARPEYVAAFLEIADRIASSLEWPATPCATNPHVRSRRRRAALVHRRASFPGCRRNVLAPDCIAGESRGCLSRRGRRCAPVVLPLARRKLIGSAALRQRAEAALGGYVGDTARIMGAT